MPTPHRACRRDLHLGPRHIRGGRPPRRVADRRHQERAQRRHRPARDRHGLPPGVRRHRSRGQGAFGILDRCPPVVDKALAAFPYAPVPLADWYTAVMSNYLEDHRYTADNMWTNASAEELMPGIHRILDTLPPHPPSHFLWLNWGPVTAAPGHGLQPGERDLPGAVRRVDGSCGRRKSTATGHDPTWRRWPHWRPESSWRTRTWAVGRPSSSPMRTWRGSMKYARNTIPTAGSTAGWAGSNGRDILGLPSRRR